MAKERRGEPESTSPGPHGMFKTTTGVHTKERKAKEGEPSARGGMSRTPLTREMTKDEKAARLTRLMRKGYRKGYRVPKRPERKSSGRSSGR